MTPPAAQTHRPVALVTGASSGIGEAFAERFAADGCDLIVVARRRDRLEALSARLHDEAGVDVDVLPADLTEHADLVRADRAVSECERLQFLVNCAGFAAYMPFATLEPDQAQSLIDVHVVAPTRLTRAALPGMIARGRGAIINVSSMLAFSASLPAPPLPQRAVYAAAKAYLNTFSEIVANEVQGTGVRVQALCPIVVRSEFHEVAGYDASRTPAVLEPADIVAASLASLDLGETVCIPSLADTMLRSTFEESRTGLMRAAFSSQIADRYLTSCSAVP